VILCSILILNKIKTKNEKKTKIKIERKIKYSLAFDGDNRKFEDEYLKKLEKN